MKTILVGVALAGCTSSQPTLLASDATFLQPQVPQCVQQTTDPQGAGDPCCQVLTLYADGEAAKLSGEEGFYGTYELDGHIANGDLFGNSFSFDLSTNVGTGSLVTGPWIADTDNLNAIACAE